MLLTSGEVRHERFYYESVFREWVQGNAESLVGERREVEEYGMVSTVTLWIFLFLDLAVLGIAKYSGSPFYSIPILSFSRLW